MPATACLGFLWPIVRVCPSRSGSVALALGVESGPAMTPECAAVKMMLCLAHPNIPLGVPIAGEM